MAVPQKPIDARPAAALVPPSVIDAERGAGQASTVIPLPDQFASPIRSTACSSALMPQALAWRSMIPTSLTRIGLHAARTAGSSAALRLISGPMPAGSPVAMAILGFSRGMPSGSIRGHQGSDPKGIMGVCLILVKRLRSWETRVITASENSSMHDVTSEHWHEPKAERTPAMAPGSGRTRLMTISWNRRASRSSAASACKRVQDMPIKRLERAWAATGTFIQLFGTEGKWGLLRGRGAGARRAQSRAPHVRGDHGGRGRPRHHRDLDRRTRRSRTASNGSRARCSRSPLNTLAPHRQRGVEPGAHPRRDHRAERDEPVPRDRLDLQLPGRRSRRASTAAPISSSRRTTSSPIRCAGLRCRNRTSSPTS